MNKRLLLNPGDIVQLKRRGTWTVDSMADGFIVLCRAVHGTRSVTSKNIRTASTVEYWKIREDKVWA